MRRIAVCLAVLIAVVAPTGPSFSQTSLRPVALVYEISTPALFAPSGEPEDTAAFNVDALLRRLRAVETDHAETPLAVTVHGVLCDELRLLDTSAADRALETIRRIALQHPVLWAPYADIRAEHESSKGFRRGVRNGRRAVERCTGDVPVEPFVPTDLSITSAERLEDLRGSGVRSMLSAFAIPPTDERPDVVPTRAVAPGDDVDPATVRPEAPSLALLVESGEIAFLDAVRSDETIELVGIGALDDLDITAGVIDPKSALPRASEQELEQAQEALDRFRSYTLDANPLRDIYATVLARSWNADGADVARGLRETIVRQRRLIGLVEGSVTFTSARGDVPITISNRADYPVLVVVELLSAKLDVVGPTGEAVEVAPPGDSVTFEALTRSSGTFPVDVTLRSPDGKVTFDEEIVIVRSVSANLSAVVLTAGGALFLVYWFIRRWRRRRKTQA